MKAAARGSSTTPSEPAKEVPNPYLLLLELVRNQPSVYPQGSLGVMKEAAYSGLVLPRVVTSYSQTGGTMWPFSSREKNLVKAIHAGDTSSVQRLLAKGANPNVQTEDGTPLIICAEVGSAAIAELLLAAGADPALPWTDDDDDPEEDDAEDLDVLDDEFDGLRPLGAAIAGGNVDVIRAILGAGLTPEEVDREIFGAAINAQADVFAALLNAGGTPDGMPERPPIVPASTFGRSDLVALLLDRGANPNTSDRDGNTALLAVLDGASGWGIQGALEGGGDGLAGLGAMLKSVIAAGPRPDEELPLHPKLIPLLRRLLEAGADPRATNKAGDTALKLAMQSCMSREVIETLLGAGCTLEPADHDLITRHPTAAVRALFN